MVFRRPDENLSLTFRHRGHHFTITAIPEGRDFTLQLADRHGPILLPLSIRIAAADVWHGDSLDRGPIDEGMAKVRQAIKELDHKRFRGLLNAPRAADEFQWTPVELDAASKMDWSKPAAVIEHEGRKFSIGTFVADGRMVILLSDSNGPFNAPFSMPTESMVRAVMSGANPVAFGVNLMLSKVRAWSAADMADFVRKTPRLDLGARERKSNRP